MNRHAIAAFGIAGALFLGAGVARADDAEAAEQFKAGAAAYAKSDFRGAAQSFERAFRESPRAAAIYNAGLAWEAASERERAADAYAKALAMPDLAPGQASDARTRLGALEKNLGKVDVSAPQGTSITIGHVDHVLAPVTIHLAPGNQEITAKLPDGSTEKKTIAITAGGAALLAFEAKPPPKLASDPIPTPPPAEPKKSIGTQKLIGFAAVGGAVIATGAAIIFGLNAVSSKDDFDASGHHDQGAHDDADSARTTANVCWVAAGVLAATGAVLVITAPSGKSTTAAIGPTGASIRVRF